MDINYMAVLASAIASMIIGGIWYGPLFGKKFMQETGMDQWTPEKQAEMKKTMGFSYALQFMASVVMFYVLSWIVNIATEMTLIESVFAAFMVWIGFVVPLKLSDAIWGGSKTLFWLNIGNMLVTLLVAGAIIGAWK